MFGNYFTSKRKATTESNSASKNKVTIGSPESKIFKKRKSLTGFSKEETPNRIKNME